jgi:hypothetical protein
MTYKNFVAIEGVNCWIIKLLHKYSNAVNGIENNRIEIESNRKIWESLQP